MTNDFSKALDFSEADLEANRRGLISDAQRQRLQRQQSLFSALVVFIGGSAVIIAVVGIVVGQRTVPLFTVAMVIFAVIEFAVLYALLNRYRQQFAADIEQGRVERYQGEVRRMSYRKRRGGLTAIYIGEYQFYADRLTWRTLTGGQRVYAYVTPASKILLSFELLD